MHAPGLASNGLIPLSVLALIGCREAEYVFTPGRGALGSGSDPERGSVYHDSRQNALPTYLSPGRAAKRKKTKRGGTTYLLQGPLGRSKPDLPTCCIGCHRGKQTPYPGRSRNPGWRRMGRCGVEGQLAREWACEPSAYIYPVSRTWSARYSTEDCCHPHPKLSTLPFLLARLRAVIFVLQKKNARLPRISVAALGCQWPANRRRCRSPS